MSPSSQRDFRFLLAAIGVSAVGSRVTRTALPMAAILVLGATPLQLGWLSVLGVLPGALVAWWAGAWIDRSSRRGVMIAADWTRALLIATIPVAALLGWLSLSQLAIVAALVCMASVLFEIADHAILPVVVPAPELIAANSKRETIDALAEVSGPPLGGVLVQWLTAPIALALDALSFVVSALLIGRIRTKEPMPDRSLRAVPGSLLREAREGAAMVWRHPLLRPLFLATMLLVFFMSFMAPLYTLYALQTLHLSPGLLGLVIGGVGLGALAGAAAAPALARRFGADPVTLTALLAGGATQVFIPLAPADPLWGALFLVVSQLAGDGLLTIFMITETSLRQQSVAVAALGRAAAVWKMAASLLAPAGMLLGAGLAEAIGIRYALWSLVFGVIVASLPLVIARRAFTQRDTAPATPRLRSTPRLGSRLGSE
ncbi:MAG: MFS transporter [Betaproteobacteria bacterium]